MSHSMFEYIEFAWIRGGPEQIDWDAIAAALDDAKLPDLIARTYSVDENEATTIVLPEMKDAVMAIRADIEGKGFDRHIENLYLGPIFVVAVDTEGVNGAQGLREFGILEHGGFYA